MENWTMKIDLQNKKHLKAIAFIGAAIIAFSALSEDDTQYEEDFYPSELQHQTFIEEEPALEFAHPNRLQPTPVQMQQNHNFDQLILGKWMGAVKGMQMQVRYEHGGRYTALLKTKRSAKPQQFTGTWNIKPLGPNRFELHGSVDGMKQTSPPDVFTVMPDGNLYNENFKVIIHKIG
jgi:hypothetical protein